MVLWRPTRLSRTNTKKDVLFIIRDWNAKVGSQEIPGATGKLGPRVEDETGQRLTEFCQENASAIANTLFQQHKRWLYTWTPRDSQYWDQTDYILCMWDTILGILADLGCHNKMPYNLNLCSHTCVCWKPKTRLPVWTVLVRAYTQTKRKRELSSFTYKATITSH